MADPVQPTAKKNSYTSAVGRRKESIARVRLMEGNGSMTVNGKPISEVFRGIIAEKKLASKYFIALNTSSMASFILISEKSGCDHGL